jgi:hypothetical protein
VSEGQRASRVLVGQGVGDEAETMWRVAEPVTRSWLRAVLLDSMIQIEINH